MTDNKMKDPTDGRLTQNKRAVFREFAAELDCALLIEENLPQCLDLRLRKNMAGVYIQLRKRGDVYVGEAIDILERQKEHLVNGVKLAALAVLPMKMTDTQGRKRVETAVIAAAQAKGIRLANISKMRLAEEMNRRKEQLTEDEALERLSRADMKAMREFGLGGWLETLEIARSKATAADWERYMNFRASSLSYAAMHAVSSFVRRVIAQPEAAYGKTWCINLNKTGCPDIEWILVKTSAGKAFQVDVLQTENDSVMKVRFLIERIRLDLLLERCELNNDLVRERLGITQGVVDIKENFYELRDDTVMKTRFLRANSKLITWEMDLDQGLELLQSRMGVALLGGCLDTVTGKPVGEGFRLGRLLF